MSQREIIKTDLGSCVCIAENYLSRAWVALNRGCESQNNLSCADSNIPLSRSCNRPNCFKLMTNLTLPSKGE